MLPAYDARVAPTQCVACKTPALDAATRDPKRSNRAIAREFRTLSEAAVRRHRANHLAGMADQSSTAAQARAPAAGPGRPSKFTDERIQRLLAAIRAGNTRQAACRYAGISDESLARWQRSSVEFVEALTRAEAESEVALVAFVRQAAQTDWRAGMELLSRRWPETWGRHDRVDVELRMQIKRLAAELELSEQEILAEAERLVADASGG
jgi:transposase